LNADQIALGFAMGSYRFEEYIDKKPQGATLYIPKDGVAADLKRQAAGVYLARDLINMPANEMRPKELEDVFCDLASHYGADVSVIAGDELLENNFPLIHTVGRASQSSPRLLEMRWGHKGHPKITLVGKGVCFDTGGLNLKPGASMSMMKKDMGGAANVLGLALMIMDVNLKVDMRVIIPAVENSVSGSAFRPGDIYKSRKGLTVQIDNTDAEGRLILADALAYADEEKPDLLIDMATLTGAARVALGPDLPPFFTDNEKLATSLLKSSKETFDPMWRMPLHKPYGSLIKARAADLTNAPAGGMAGAITAALFLQRFVTKTKNWVHMDIYGWTQSNKPHASVGGEAQCIRALYHHIRHNLKKKK
jgi:leucyl aminopeptidase